VIVAIGALGMLDDEGLKHLFDACIVMG